MFSEAHITNLVLHILSISLPDEFEDHTKMEESLFNMIDLRMLTSQSSLLQAVEKLLTKELAVMKDSIQNFHLVMRKI